ncbi:hypothetical protein ACHAQA_005580 [Verticillium albo-atrum]
MDLRQLTRLLARSGTMAEALLGLAPASRFDDPQTNKFPIHHPEQIQDQLRRAIEYRVHPTRAEHVSITLDIRNTVQFTLVTTESEAPQANVDPALGGAPPATQTPGSGATKTVRVNDVLVNQPQDDPSLQRHVAKHIVELLSAADGTAWVVRDISRGSHGWTFTYVCKDSLAVWMRQYQKSPAKGAIGDYSLKDPTMPIFERPAFDCLGALKISFSKSSRVISIKYDHTPFHKTVAQMVEHFRPPPPPIPVASVETPEKTKKTPRKSKAAAEGGEGSARPRKRQKKSDAVPRAPEAPMDLPDHLGAGPAQTRADEVVQSSVHSHAILNVPPAEAARRRETAIRLLSEGGVEPETLSQEQFSIFANQSPDLQRESLTMLAKYGAERLRIVHPKDATGSETPAGGSSAEPTPQSSGEQAAVNPSLDIAEATEVGKRPAKPKLTRGSCTPCRSSKTKCDRTKPECDACIATGTSCEYALQQTRGQKSEQRDKPAKPQKSAARVEPDESEEAEDDDIEPIDYTSNMPVADAADRSNHDYFNTSPGFPPMNTEDQGTNNPNMSYPAPPATAEETYSDLHIPTVGSPPRARHANEHRGLPLASAHAVSSLEQSQAQVQADAQALPTSHTAGWQDSASSTNTRSISTRSPTLSKQVASQQQQSPHVSQPAEPARAKSRSGQKSQTPRSRPGTSTPSQHNVQQTQPRAAPTYGAAADLTALPQQNPYTNRYSSTTDRQTAPTRLSYEPYAAQASAASSASYPSQASYTNSRAPSTSASMSGQVSQQPTTTGFTTTTAAASNQNWSDSHGHSTQSYGTNASTSAASAYTNQASATAQQQQPSPLQQYNMRSSSSRQQPRNQEAQQTYGSYGSQSQPQASTRQQAHEQTQPSAAQQQQQQNWYGGYGATSPSSSFTPANASSVYGTRSSGPANYGSGASGAGSYGQQHAQQHHHQHHGSLNMSGQHGYGGADGDIFDLLKAGMNSR